jgi:molybdopterin-synthase adenylyltransferase
MYRLLIPSDMWRTVDDHLRQQVPGEDGAFLLVHSGRGASSTRLIAHDLFLPDETSWEARGHHRLRPSGQWLSAVIGAAIETASGIAFVHSHPNANHPPVLSLVDQETSIGWSRLITPMLGRQFLSLVWTPASVSGWVFEADKPGVHKDIDRIVVLGMGASTQISPGDSFSADAQLDDRQIRAVGELGNNRLRESTVAVVGAGGTGSPVAEQLVRMGVRRLIVIDADHIDTPSNLRRVVGSRSKDLDQGTLKVNVVARHLSDLHFSDVLPLPVDVRTKEAAEALLDADLVISTTDTHSSRSFVNQLAHQYLLPVIDVGVKVGTSLNGRISGMPVDVRTLLPDTACLWCSGILDSARIRAENLPEYERDAQIREGYIQAVNEPQPSLTALNFFASSLSVLTMLRMLSSDGVISSRTIADGWEHYFADSAGEIDSKCICHTWRSMGDETRITYLPIP